MLHRFRLNKRNVHTDSQPVFPFSLSSLKQDPIRSLAVTRELEDMAGHGRKLEDMAVTSALCSVCRVQKAQATRVCCGTVSYFQSRNVLAPFLNETVS